MCSGFGVLYKVVFTRHFKQNPLNENIPLAYLTCPRIVCFCTCVLVYCEVAL